MLARSMGLNPGAPKPPTGISSCTPGPIPTYVNSHERHDRHCHRKYRDLLHLLRRDPKTMLSRS